MLDAVERFLEAQKACPQLDISLRCLLLYLHESMQVIGGCEQLSETSLIPLQFQANEVSQKFCPPASQLVRRQYEFKAL